MKIFIKQFYKIKYSINFSISDRFIYIYIYKIRVIGKVGDNRER